MLTGTLFCYIKYISPCFLFLAVEIFHIIIVHAVIRVSECSLQNSTSQDLNDFK